MSRTKINYLIDAGLAVSFVIVFITGIVKWPGLVNFFGFTYRNLPMRKISLVHDWSGLLMGILVMLHLALHWKWIMSMTKKMFKIENKK